MLNKIIEGDYPIRFREKESLDLGTHLKNRNSVVLIGMKRVGISNFLRFFLNHKDIAATYIKDNSQHLFIPVDFNDLVEREIFPFWILTLKRILDSVEKNLSIPSIKDYIEKLFLDSMQSKDVFLTIEMVRKSLVKLVELGILPTIFFIRFDRLKDIATPEFFSNLQGLKDATNQKLTYVFTSYRDLASLAPSVFSKSALSLFVQNMFIKPAEKKDIKIIFATQKDRFRLSLEKELENSLFEIVDGYVQYLQLALVALHETEKKFLQSQELFTFLAADERISLQSEELWESLEKEEQLILLKLSSGKNTNQEEKQKASYLWDTGFLEEKNKKAEIFSKLFAFYVKKREEVIQNHTLDFTKKENLLFNFLKENLSQLCERESIIEGVWPEVEALGVSDWAIDRLVARVRNKLKLQKSKFEIQTVKTRGYKLIEV